MNRTFLIAITLAVTFLALMLTLTITVIRAMVAQRQQLRDMKEEVTQIRIQVRAEFLRIQECLDKIGTGKS